MANGVELATAWVRLVPTMTGVQGAVASQLAPVSGMASTAGTKAGGLFTSGFSSRIAPLAGMIAGVFATKAIIDWVSDSVSALKNWQTINAQSNAVIASTGGTANVTAAQVHTLAQSIEGATASQAESIQQGANMLLTFKNIRNEAGAGNDIFNQSVLAMTNMGRAMGTDANGAAIQLGKALNDPIAGISSLARAGVQFTDQQKDTIKSLVDSGQTMEAQKIILAELNAQFGGSGAAYAETYAGKMYLFGDAVGDLGEKLLGTLMPGLTNLAIAGTGAFGWIADNLPLVGGITGAILLMVLAVQAHNAAMTIAAAGGVAQYLAKLPIVTAAQWLFNAAMSANPIGIIIVLIAALVAGLIYFFTQTELGQQVWENITSFIGTVVTWLWESVLQPIFTAIGAIWDWLYNNIILPIVTGIMIYIGLWAAVITWLWENVIAPYFAFIGAIFEWIWNTIIMPIVDFIVAYVQMWGAIFGWLYENAVKPAFDAVGAIFTWLWETIIKPTSDFIGLAIQVVGNTIRSVFGGISDFIGAAFQSVLSVVRGPINALIDLINGIIGGLNSISVKIPDWVPIVGGQTFGLSIPKIPRLAKGGIVMPQAGGVLSLLAERGRPEVVLPLDRLRDFGFGDDGSDEPDDDFPNRGGNDPTNLSDDSIDRLALAIARAQRPLTRQGGPTNG